MQYIVIYIQLSSDTSYDKIKHLVEIEDDIFAVFTINSTGESYGLTVAKNIDFEKSLVEKIYTNFNTILKPDDKITEILTTSSSDILGRLKWKVIEYEKIRILQIADKNKIVVVLIKSNTTLDETVDNILGYYYEDEEDEDNIPKSLF
ncbi:MAG TPA: hypothetical protein VFC05_06225 [Nitrososphaeraceae archaeon]|jgi:hypothetical protein|nr:hypothetical protein [Nitrososphaeraceae archaeon]